MKNRVRWLTVLVGVAMAGMGGVVFGQVAAESGAGEAPAPLRVYVGGPGADELPWLRWGDDGPTGHEPGLAAALGEALGRPVAWVGMDDVPRGDHDPRLALLEAGEADIAVLAVTVTDGRAERVAFSEPYFVTGLCVVVSEGSALLELEDARRVAEALDGCRVYALHHSTAYDWVTRHAPGARVTGTLSLADARRYGGPWGALGGGRFDAIVTDPTYARLALVEHSALRVLPGLLNVERLAVAVDPDQPELLTAVNAALATLREDGTLAALRARWFSEADEAGHAEDTDGDTGG